MTRLVKTYRYRIYPSRSQTDRIIQWESALRFLWNLANEQRWNGLRRTDRRYPTAFDQMRELTELRASLPWLSDVPRNVCAQLLVELDQAWRRCFKSISQPPRWKRKGRASLSLKENHSKMWRLDGEIIRFPKLGNLRAVIHRPLVGKPKTCTLKRDGDQWFASIVCELELPDPVPRIEPVVAIDRGITNIIADSDGRLVPNPKHFEKTLARLKRAQRTVSRRKKGSKNREKAKLRVMRLHRKVRRQREHFLHCLSAGYAKSHGTVVVEKLPIGRMCASASGTLATPGRNVRAKAGLNRHIAHSGWGAVVTMLRYKLGWSGGTLAEVPSQYSSQTCSVCGHVDAASRSQEYFRCIACGHVDHADLNAAKVLKSRANRSALPAEGSALLGSRRSRKSRPTRIYRHASIDSSPMPPLGGSDYNVQLLDRHPVFASLTETLRVSEESR